MYFSSVIFFICCRGQAHRQLSFSSAYFVQKVAQVTCAASLGV